MNERLVRVFLSTVPSQLNVTNTRQGRTRPLAVHYTNMYTPFSCKKISRPLVLLVSDCAGKVELWTRSEMLANFSAQNGV
jgi:hypothetical protein